MSCYAVDIDTALELEESTFLGFVFLKDLDEDKFMWQIFLNATYGENLSKENISKLEAIENIIESGNIFEHAILLEDELEIAMIEKALEGNIH